MGIKSSELFSMGLFPDENGGYRVGTPREKAMAGNPPLKKKPVTGFNFLGINEKCEFFIPGDVRSSKNSKRIVTNKGTGKKIIIKSKACMEYLANTKYYWQALSVSFRNQTKDLPLPLHIEFHFVYSKEFVWDYHNMVQFPMDLMVDFGWIDDDDKKSVKPFFKDYSICKEKPGLYISIL